MDEPIITSIEFVSDVLTAEDFNIREQNFIQSGEMDTLGIQAHVVCSLSVRNEGNSIANVFLLANVDTISWAPVLRDIFLNESAVPVKVTLQEKAIEILPGEVESFLIERPVQFVDSARFILHIHIVYENELDHVFDTYIWREYSIRFFEGELGFRAGGEMAPFNRFIIRPNNASRWVKPIDKANDSYLVYDAKEATLIREALFRGRY